MLACDTLLLAQNEDVKHIVVSGVFSTPSVLFSLIFFYLTDGPVQFVSSDGDFFPVMQVLATLHPQKRLYLFYKDGCLSDTLLPYTYRHIAMDKDPAWRDVFDREMPSPRRYHEVW